MTMKKMRYITLAFMTLVIVQLMCGQSIQSNKRVRVTVNEAKQIADSLIIDLDITTDGKPIKSNNSLNLTPILVINNTTEKLPGIEIKGRRNYKAYLRQLSLMSHSRRAAYQASAPYAVIKGYKKAEIEKINYHLAIPFNPWMSDAQLVLKEDDCGCGETSISEMIILAEAIELDRVVSPYTIQPFVAYIIPEAETIKKRFIECEAVMDFAVGRSELVMDRGNNAAEMNKIISTMNSVLNDDDINITGVEIAGYASPEGNALSNQKLSENRAKALKNALMRSYNYPENFYSSYFGGEDWEGLVNELSQSSYPYREAIIAIINGNENIEQRKAEVKRYANGMPYREMLITLYPALRRVVFKANFDVRQFDVEEAKRVLQINPQHLSLNEMFYVANQYPEGSKAFNEVFFIAAKTYPDSPEANINAATAAIEQADYDRAGEYLRRIDSNYSSPHFYNALGILQMMKENNYKEAQRLFERAAQEGLNSAIFNLNELNKKYNNINEMKGKMP